MREPAIFYWPGTIEPKVVTGIGSGLDLLPTIAALAGNRAAERPRVRRIRPERDAAQRRPEPARPTFSYWRLQDVYAVRKGPYKAHFTTMASFSQQPPERHAQPLLYNLDIDPSEHFDIADQHPEIVRRADRHGGRAQEDDDAAGGSVGLVSARPGAE